MGSVGSSLAFAATALLWAGTASATPPAQSISRGSLTVAARKSRAGVPERSVLIHLRVGAHDRPADLSAERDGKAIAIAHLLRDTGIDMQIGRSGGVTRLTFGSMEFAALARNHTVPQPRRLGYYPRLVTREALAAGSAEEAVVRAAFLLVPGERQFITEKVRTVRWGRWRDHETGQAWKSWTFVPRGWGDGTRRGWVEADFMGELLAGIGQNSGSYRVSYHHMRTMEGKHVQVLPDGDVLELAVRWNVLDLAAQEERAGEN